MMYVAVLDYYIGVRQSRRIATADKRTPGIAPFYVASRKAAVSALLYRDSASAGVANHAGNHIHVGASASLEKRITAIFKDEPRKRQIGHTVKNHYAVCHGQFRVSMDSSVFGRPDV